MLLTMKTWNLISLLLLILLVLEQQAGAFLLHHAAGRTNSLQQQHVVVTSTRSSHLHGSNGGGMERETTTTNPTTTTTTATTNNNNVDESTVLERRDLFEVASAGALASLLLMGSTGTVASASTEDSSSSSSKPQQTIVITGANSGIGFEACKQLAKKGDYKLILPCRTLAKAKDAVELLQKESPNGNFVPAECDLASMASIKSFAGNLPSLIGGANNNKIDCLCLNAGLARNTAATDVARTADGFELTVGTNYFGHYYMCRLLMPMVDATSGRIVVTASGVHDPSSPGGKQGVPATLGDLQGLEQLGKECEMIDGNPFNADKAYKDSKLCNVLFTRELQRRLSSNSNTRGIVANCFNPGLIVGTGFFRDQNPLFTKVFDFAATDLLKVGETTDYGGGCLAYMTGVTTQGMYYSSDPGTAAKYGDTAYGNQFTVETPSKEAQDDGKAKRLWDLSEKALGL